MAEAAPRLTALAEELLGTPLPVRIRAWDGSQAGPPDAPALVVRHRRALRRLLWRPGELGLARAWVTGEIEVEGDLYEVLDRLAGLLWERSPGTGKGQSMDEEFLPRWIADHGKPAGATVAELRTDPDL
ncbi:hypothetical protein AB0C51_13400, partial [Streptomyces pathocidini]